MTQVAACQRCRKAIHAEQSEAWCLGCGTPLVEEIQSLLPKLVELREAAALAVAQPKPPATISRGERTFRGIVGMGAVFGFVGFAILGAFSAKALLLNRSEIGDDLDLILVAPFAAGAIASGLGMLYGGLLALLARGRSFRELSIARVATAGAAVGLAPLTIILASPLWGGTVTADEVLVTLTLFPPLSATVAAATLLIARRARPEAMPELPDEEL
jgi:hypothetical protein